MEEVIGQYFASWLDKDISVLKNVFAHDIVYSECYGPVYRGIEQVLVWFKDWNNRGTVLKWDIKQIMTVNNTAIVEWYFECDYEGNISGFDGVTLAQFNDEKRICELKEFQSKAEHYYPYG